MKRRNWVKAATALLLSTNLAIATVMAAEPNPVQESENTEAVVTAPDSVTEDGDELQSDVGESAEKDGEVSPTEVETSEAPEGYWNQIPADTEESTEAVNDTEQSSGTVSSADPEQTVEPGTVDNTEDMSSTEVIEEEEQPEINTASVVKTYTVTPAITATLDSDGLLTIQGSGKMPSFASGNPPWNTERLQIKKLIVRSGITEIGEAEFFGCSNLQEVEIAPSVTTIGKGAFANAGIHTIRGMDGVLTIGDYAFQGCSFTSVSLPAGAITIGKYIFFRCNQLTSITVPARVRELGSIAYQCPKLTSITVNASNASYASVDGILYSKDKKTLIAVPAGKSMTSFTIPSTVSKIQDYAFFGQSTLQSISIPASVKEIGEYAFHSTKQLKSLTIPETVTSVGVGICWNSTGLETLNFLAAVEVTPYSMCYGCTSLKKAVLGNHIQELYLRTFMGCSSLTSVVLPAGLKKIDVYAFKSCSGLSSLAFPETITYIQAGAFEGSRVTAMPSWLQKNASGDYVKLTNFSIAGTYQYDMAYEVLALVNQQRQAAGLRPLSMDQELLNAAMLRSAENCLYFGHDRPDGTDCFTVSAKMSAENVAAGSTTASAVMDNWMNSSGHRANILGSNYNSIGIGCFIQNGMPYWVQVFSTNTAAPAVRPGNRSVIETVQVSCELLDGAAFRLRQATNTYGKGGKLTLLPCVTNLGWSYASCQLQPSAFSWSSNTSGITVNENGVVNLGVYGSFTITARLKSSPYAVLSFNGNCNSEANKTRLFVERLYETCLGRDSEVEGLDYWTAELAFNRQSGAAVGYGFVFSDEYKNKNTADSDFVEMLYQVFMDRQSDAGGKAYWMNLLQQGLSREYVFAGFAHSQEYTSICNSYGITRGTVVLSQPRDKNPNLTAFVNRIYVEAMGRTGEADGLNYWCSSIQNGDSPIRVSEFFINSQEFRNKNLNNTEYIKVLYRTFMGREADHSGLNYWLGRLNGGESREAVLKSFAGCPEFQNIIKSFGL